MQTNARSKWAPRVAAAGIFALSAWSAGYWWLQHPQAASVSTAVAALSDSVLSIAPGTLAAALGAQSAAPATPTQPTRTNLVLLGVVADAAGQGGAALISIDGKPARPYLVGSELAGTYVLQSVQGRRAHLRARDAGAGSVTLELPPLSR